MKSSEILRAGKTRIEDESLWSQFLPSDGECGPIEKVCSIVSIVRTCETITNYDERDLAIKFLDKAAFAMGFNGIVSCNAAGHEVALNMYNLAIRFAITEESNNG